ncbi:MAG: hypothetical protein HYW81_02590 [Parcubacteria group bacterium]|nr:hypothetical protein [Parcubacteria group bacterium]
MPRITANSASLKKAFPQEYRDLFSRSEIVCSAPGNFFWSGEYIVRYGGIAVKQNLPLRAYVGIETCERGILELGAVRTYIPSRQRFETHVAESLPTTKNIVRHIREYLKERKHADFGLRFQVLMEVPPGCGLAASASLSVALATALHVHLRSLSPENVPQWKTIPTPELVTRSDFESVFRLAWEIEDIIHGGSGKSSGAGPFSCMVGSLYPLIYLPLVNLETLPEHANPPRYWGIKMEEFYKLSHRPSWPIDFGLIYSGDVGETASAIASIESFKENLHERIEAVKREFARYEELKPVIAHDTLFNTENKQKKWESVLDGAKIGSIMVLGAFRDIFTRGLSEGPATKLFKAMNMVQRSLSFASFSSPIIDYLCLTIRREVRRLQDIYGAGAKLTGKGKCGDVLFAVAYHGLRDTIGKLINRMRRETSEDFFLDYASWLDGFEEEGVKVEQSLADGLYADFVARGALQVTHTDRGGTQNTRLYTVNQFEEEKQHMDVILHMPKHKILLHGSQLTSKELRSASATIELLQILLSRLGKPISNKELPASSYTADRNELQSKIITPLSHAIQKRLKADLNLKVSGPIRNFTVTLAPGGVDFYVIDKAF